MDHNQLEVVLAQQPKTYKKTLAITALVVAILLVCLPFVQFDAFSKDGVKVTSKILSYFLDPDWGNLFNFSSVSGVPFLLLETVCIALLGTLIGAVLSLPLAFVSSRNITGNKISSIGVIFITLIRCVPALVYVLIFVQVETGAVAGILAFAVTSVGMISKLFIEAIEELDRGIIEALDASGASTFQKIRFGIIPQLKSNFLSTILYRFEINVKNATILGMVGAGGIGGELIMAMNYFRWRDSITMIIGIIVLVLVLESFSSRLRDKLING